MGIDLWFKTSFVANRPSFLKVKVLNFKFIKVTFNAEKNPDFRFPWIRKSGLNSLNDSPGRPFGAGGTKFGSIFD